MKQNYSECKVSLNIEAIKRMYINKFKTRLTFSNESGIDPSVLSRIESGQSPTCNIITAVKIAKTLDVAIEDILIIENIL